MTDQYRFPSLKNTLLFFLVLTTLLFMGCSNKREGDPKVLVFSKTMGFKHSSIPSGIAAIQKLGLTNGFGVDTTSNANMFREDSLTKYAAIIFMNTTGNVLDHMQEAAFERYIQAGGGFVGVHAAADTEYDWNWYGKLVGAYFNGHPPGTQEADFIIKDTGFEATGFFTDSIWRRTDEMYNFKKINPDVNVLLTIDENTYKGGTNGDFHPMSWYHEYDGGRAFYTALGHTQESYTEDNYLKHLLGGINYAIGKNLKLDYAKASSQIPPDVDRFSKTPLSTGEFFEPTEMTILPNNDVLIAQRRGEIMLYKDNSKKLTQVGFLDVYHKTLHTPNVNAEEGLMGLQQDPDFATNNWVYVYYSPTGDKWVNRLSRFKFKNDVFDIDSEQIILEVGSQREICCHTGGSIAFGPDGLLYLSTGDNSTPFNEKNAAFVNNGFAPLNDEPGKEQYDAGRSSGNTNDLRGKILRIRVKEDGTYDIPEGNLFPKGLKNTRPEIYTMGHRNPYRISVDQKNGYLYWGDVGPDSRKDSLSTRGPKGYDEMNQARGPGNFGWPFFIADNKPYFDYDYKTGKTGAAFTIEKPINDSRNNTGLRELPQAMPAFVYYPYVESQDFPQVGTGGRNAMAGPAYYSDLYDGENKLPSYYDGKIIIYDWMRGWMKAVSLFKNGDFNKMEPFAPEVVLNNLIDMEVGPDGRVYLLEYGSGWFSQNEDSGLSYISFNGGNRPPVIDEIQVYNSSGKLPLSVTVKVIAKDLEGDGITYIWDLGNGTTQETAQPQISHTYREAGEYKLSVKVKDDKNAVAQSAPVAVVAGNSTPEVKIDITSGNPSFFIPGKPFSYSVSVSDEGSTAGIDASNIFVSLDYMEGMDEVSLSTGHQQVSEAVSGKAITESMDCKACHKEKEASIGPNYMDIAKRYKDKKGALGYLQTKIIEGSSGVWGEVMMPAHPTLTKNESRQIAVYIRSLIDHNKKKKSLAAQGTITPRAKAPNTSLVLTASYTDNGGENNTKPLTGMDRLTLTSNTVLFSGPIASEGFSTINYGGMDLLMVTANKGWFALENIDLTGVKTARITAGWQDLPKVGLDVELRQDSVNGKLIGKTSMPAPKKGQENAIITIPVKSISDKGSTIYVVYSIPDKKPKPQVPLALLNIRFD